MSGVLDRCTLEKFFEMRLARVLPLAVMDARFGSLVLGSFSVDLVSLLGKRLRKLRLALSFSAAVFLTSLPMGPCDSLVVPSFGGGGEEHGPTHSVEVWVPRDTLSAPGWSLPGVALTEDLSLEGPPRLATEFE